MALNTRLRAALIALAVGVPGGLSGCGPADPRPVGGVRPAEATAGAAPVAAEPLTLAVTPATGTRDLPISTEVGTAVTGGRVTTVRLTDGAGRAVAGSLREDGTAWVPARPLSFGTSYAARVTVTAPDGRTEARTTTFRTMPGRPAKRVGSGLYLWDGATYGAAMPVVVEFNPGIRPTDRAGVQRRLFVTSAPAQPGVWHWIADGTQVYYRPPGLWRPGTRLTVRVALDGHPVGGGRYGDIDRRATATIGRTVLLEVENRTKQLAVYRDGALLRRLPVSLGKKSTPSSSGVMVIMDKQEKTVFDTFAELGPREGYRTTIRYAQRLTWGGEFLHAAPWSVGDQGRRNVSHGCVNVSSANATWLFGLTLIGDPVTVRGTEQRLVAGNGWTPWSIRWSEYVKGSALPVPPDLAAADGDPLLRVPGAPTPSIPRGFEPRA